jgi:predicted sugar kinase
MLIEVGAPCSLPLAFIRTGADATGLQYLGITLQHPPVDVFAEPAPDLSVTGPRADIGYAQALRFLQHHRLEPRGRVEIELAIPDLMGLGSEAMLGLSIARALAWVHGLPFDDTPALAQAVGLGSEHALAVWGFDRGGVLVVDTQAAPDGLAPCLRRHALSHREDAHAWAFVLLFPPTPTGAAGREAEPWAAFQRAGSHIGSATGDLFAAELWPALERDDIAAFGQALQAIQDLNRQALAAAGLGAALSPEEQQALEVLREAGAVAWGRSPTGLALYGLLRGASATLTAREMLRNLVGFHGGRVMATIADNDGGRHVLREMRPISG